LYKTIPALPHESDDKNNNKYYTQNMTDSRQYVLGEINLWNKTNFADMVIQLNVLKEIIIILIKVECIKKPSGTE